METKITGEKELCTDERLDDKEIIHIDAKVTQDQRDDYDLCSKFSDRKLVDDVS